MGKDPAWLMMFISQCVTWFLGKPWKFATDRNCVLFATSYLRDQANTWWMPYLIQQPPPAMLDNWDSFTTELFLVFGNPHLHMTSKSTLHNLKMPNNSHVTEYIVAFNLHMPYTRYNNAALAEAFYQGLTDHIKDQFQYMS